MKAKGGSAYIQHTFLLKSTANELQHSDDAAVRLSDESSQVIAMCIDALPISSTETSVQQLEDFYSWVNAGIDVAKHLRGTVSASSKNADQIDFVQLVREQYENIKKKTTNIIDAHKRIHAYRLGIFLGALVSRDIRSAIGVLRPDEFIQVLHIISAFRMCLSVNDNEVAQDEKSLHIHPFVSKSELDKEMAHRHYLWQDNKYVYVKDRQGSAETNPYEGVGIDEKARAEEMMHVINEIIEGYTPFAVGPTLPENRSEIGYTQAGFMFHAIISFKGHTVYDETFTFVKGDRRELPVIHIKDIMTLNLGEFA